MKIKLTPVFKVLKSNWVVTIMSTMIGVVIGLYLTNYNESQKLNKAQQTAFEMVKQELNKNHETLIAYDSISTNTYHNATYVFSQVNNDFKIVIHKASIPEFETNSKGIMNNVVFEALPEVEDSVRVRGEMNLNLNSKLALIDLNNVIWESYKQTDFLNVTNFECVTALEELYQFQDTHNSLNRRWMNEFSEGAFLKGKLQLSEFMILWD